MSEYLLVSGLVEHRRCEVIVLFEVDSIELAEVLSGIHGLVDDRIEQIWADIGSY